MSAAHDLKGREWWSRPSLERTGPIRSAGGVYRTAETGGESLGGVPLVTAEDAAVAAVRMAYRVAETQIARSGRLADRLRDAGDRAVGEQSDRKALDATERLIFRSMMSAAAWLEAGVAEGDTPVRRLMATQYRVIGSMLGLTQPARRRPSADTAPGVAPHAANMAMPPKGAVAGPNSKASRVKIVLKSDEAQMGGGRQPVRRSKLGRRYRGRWGSGCMVLQRRACRAGSAEGSGRGRRGWAAKPDP